jgi:sugar O-acyltransferase (sialic acid O-acetyltransferase NeuD family)
MPGNKEKLVIIGDGETAELAYDYFSRDADFIVVGFSAEEAFRRNTSLFGLPVVPLEQIEQFFDPKTHRAFIAISYTQLNRLRTKLFNLVKQKGYRLCSYISPYAFVGSNVEIGDNCFIFENVTIQRGSKIGDNVTIWTGSSVGHRSAIANNCFIATHVAISGFCSIGENSFLGVNSCTTGNIKIGKDCVIGAGAVLIKDTAEGQIYVGNPARTIAGKKTDVFIYGKEAV